MRLLGILLLSGTGVAVAGCATSRPAVEYAEGQVVLSGGDHVQVGRTDISKYLGAQDVRHLDGLDVGVALARREARIVSPVEDTWQAFANAAGLTADTVPRDDPAWAGAATSVSAFPDRPRLLRLADSFQSVDARFRAFSSSGRPPLDHELHALVNDYKALVANAFDTAEVAVDPVQRQRLIDLGADGQTKLQGGLLMAYEAGLRRSPQFYRSVGRDAGAAVAVVRLGGIIGTGFLISREWLLTNRHVVAGILDLRTSTAVEFDREEPASTLPSEQRSCEIVDERIAEPASPLDLAALKFKCRSGFPPSWDGRILRLATRETSLNEGVYVVGHPFSGPKQVVDNAFVRYPYRLSSSARAGLRQLSTEPGERALFDRFYEPCEQNSWCYRSSPARWGAAGDAPSIPTVGFDSNTAPGNSGSPVLSVADHTVVGVFFGGARDYAVQGRWSFTRHEAAIPAAAIRTWLAANAVAVP